MPPSFPPTPAIPADPGPLPNEPPLWYHRYCLYRYLGPNRTLQHAFHASGRRSHCRPGHAWHTAAAAWHWAARAAAWDAEQRRILAAGEHERRLDARCRRQAMLSTLLEQTYEILLTVRLDALDLQALHDLLPTIRHLFRDLLAAEQREYEFPSLSESPSVLSVEDLQTAHRQLEAWRVSTEADHSPTQSSSYVKQGSRN